jgi:CheY-like chemotaxis protein
VGKITIETGNVDFDRAFCRDHPDFVPGQYVLMAVSDNGCGMDDAVRSHVFEPFFTTKAEGRGTGLGLATVYGIVKQNRGFINLYSEPGKGTSFKIYLPREAGPVTPEVEADRPDIPRGRGETVLLVEDEAAVLKLGRMILEGLGYRVLAAAGPDEALALSRTHAGRIHLLITDVVMPEMNGRDLAARLKTETPDLKVLFMSGYTADIITERGGLADKVHFVQKPFSRQDLAVKVAEALGQSEAA